MKYRLTLLAAFAGLMCLGTADVSAFGRRAMPAPAAGYYYYYGPGPGVTDYYYYNPYVAPLPAYDILPQPLATMQLRNAAKGRSAAAAPQRPTPAPTERVVHFVVNVPYADAIVTFNGLPTKETGLTRRFKTTLLPDNDHPIIVTIAVQWKKGDNLLTEPRVQKHAFTPRQTDTVVANFKE